jgi:hypothetical protein
VNLSEGRMSLERIAFEVSDEPNSHEDFDIEEDCDEIATS